MLKHHFPVLRDKYLEYALTAISFAVLAATILQSL